MPSGENIKHGMSYTPTYNSWRSMIARCANPNNEHYKYYGGKGVDVCERWQHSFENFYLDMGERPAGMTLDRIDGDLGYSPDNCRWATKIEQRQNRNDIKPFTICAYRPCSTPFKHKVVGQRFCSKSCAMYQRNTKEHNYV